MIIGESIPDKDDPRYKEKYKRQIIAGRRFARTLHLDKFAFWLQSLAMRHTRAFLISIFSFLAVMFVISIYRIYSATVYATRPQQTAIERQERELKKVLNSRTHLDKDNINKNSQ